MKNVSYWDKFMRSGSVEDYLKFKSCMREEEAGTGAKAKDGREEGEYPHAGFYHGNGDDIKGDAYR